MANLNTKRNIQPFNGEKYSVWKFRIRSLLTELKVIKVIDQPTPDMLTDDWIEAEAIAKNIIVEYLADSFLSFVQSANSAKQVLRDLDALYERKSVVTQLAIKKKLLNLKLESDTPLIKHFQIFDELISELSAAGDVLKETDKVSNLLMTLPASYDGIITAIETLSDDNLTLAFIKTRLLDYEVKLMNENRDTSLKVLSADFKINKTKKNNYKISRNFKNQYPNNNKNKSYKFKGQIKGCYQCGRTNHIKKDCYYYKRQMKNANIQNEKVAQTIELIQPSTSSGNYNTSSTNYDPSRVAFMVGEYEEKDKSDQNKITFILDSGASDHIINREDVAENFDKFPVPIKISVAKNGTYISATKKGTINIITNRGIQGTLQDVYYCPEVPYNLLSVRRIQQAGMSVTFDELGVRICKNDNIVISCKPLNNLTVINFMLDMNFKNCVAQATSAERNDYTLWHQRLGHIGKNKFLELKNKEMFVDIKQIEKVRVNDNLCEACVNGKQARLPFRKAKDKSHVRRPLFIVHTDVCGPITPTTINERNYFVLFLDEYTHYCVTYLIVRKSDVFSAFRDYVAKSEAHFNLKLVNLYSDNGREYLSNEMKDYCVEKGISYHLTVPRTPQLNGVSERMVRTITEKARAMVAGAGLGKAFWGEAVLTATYLLNITPTRVLKESKTPYEMWHMKKPQLRYLRVFGSTVYIHNKTRESKFDDKSWKGILVGYEVNGYKVWNVGTGKFNVVRDVIMDETNFVVSRPVMVRSETDKSKSVISQKSNNDKLDTTTTKVVETNENAKLSNELNKSVIETDTCIESFNNNSNKNDNNDNEIGKLSSELRRSDRIKHRPTVSYNEEEMPDDYLLSAQSIVYEVPKSYHEIENRNDKMKWKQAIKDEINSLLINNTWTLVPKPNNKNIVDCKWVFTIKNDEHGNPLKYKARLVARGFSQQYLVDYNETFAPVARISSFRFILAFANQFDLLVHHMDVKTAFLNGTLKEEIYMRVPEGIKSSNNEVCRLNKALYGLKQAARCWFEVFEQALIERSFKNSSVDRCIYILDKGDVSRNIYVVLYVDDLVIATADIEVMNSFKNYLMNKFCMKDLKDIKLFLGIKIERSKNSICMDQSAYIKTILEKFNMTDCKAISTPLENKLDYTALNSDEKHEAPCRNLIGCLMYVMLCTRPDLSTAVNILSRYLTKNNKELWQCLKRVLRYLKGSMNIKLIYIKGDYNDLLCGYVDSDWAGNDRNDRRSTTGYLFKLFEQCTICWSTRRQASVAASSTEAEYMALFEAVREALWLRSLAKTININISEPITIYEDNTGCISIANNPTNHKRSKHIDIKYHFSREQIENNKIRLKYVPTGNQLADILTKPLPAVTFLQLRDGMGLK